LKLSFIPTRLEKVEKRAYDIPVESIEGIGPIIAERLREEEYQR